MKTEPSLGLLCLVASIAMVACGQTRPVSGGSSDNSSASSPTDTQWKGIYGSGTSANIPATLSVHSQGGSGTLTYDGYEETVAITSTGPRTLSMKGVSYRDLHGGRTFNLDTFTLQISPDGNSMNGNGGDTSSVVANEWLQLQKVP
ncbi:MAG TPA: hypothetical protein VLY24_28540 [Bryobacteraceae bacterium]|nr:hypothetical protein [Bryobacteraceae bacterium]